jgi:hypothetical protein
MKSSLKIDNKHGKFFEEPGYIAALNTVSLLYKLATIANIKSEGIDGTVWEFFQRDKPGAHILRSIKKGNRLSLFIFRDAHRWALRMNTNDNKALVTYAELYFSNGRGVVVGTHAKYFRKAPLNVLLICDNEDDEEALKKAMDDAGKFDLTVATSAGAGYLLTEPFDFDAIIWACIRVEDKVQKIRKLRPELPMLAFGNPPHINTLIEAGCNTCIDRRSGNYSERLRQFLI